jgi:predicted MFS family arabinose efflux permease
MNHETPAPENESPKRLFVPSLTLLIIVINISNAVLSLFLPEIAQTFLGSKNQTAIGIASQTSTVNSAAEVALAFAMSFLAIRFRHKLLLQAGAVLVIISTLGSYLAPDFITFQIFFAMEGAGSVMVSILAIAIIGDTIHSTKKARAVSWFIAGSYFTVIIGLPTLLLVANAAGWRSTFLLFGLPVSIAGLILASIYVPSKPNQQPRIGKDTYLDSFKQVLLNKSSLACIIGRTVGSASIVSLFVITFYQAQLSLTRNLAAGLGLINATLFLAGSLIGGRLITKFGAKRVAVTCGFCSGILTAAFFNMPTIGLTLLFNFLSVIIGAFGIPAFVYLTLDQVPKSRGTMMSIHRIAGNTGEAIGAATGGMLLALFSYQVMGLAFGAFAMASAAIFLFLVKQPTET